MRGSTLMGPPRVGSYLPTDPKASGPAQVCRGPLDRSSRAPAESIARPRFRYDRAALGAVDRTRLLDDRLLGWERVLRFVPPHLRTDGVDVHKGTTNRRATPHHRRSALGPGRLGVGGVQSAQAAGGPDRVVLVGRLHRHHGDHVVVVQVEGQPTARPGRSVTVRTTVPRQARSRPEQVADLHAVASAITRGPGEQQHARPRRGRPARSSRSGRRAGRCPGPSSVLPCRPSVISGEHHHARRRATMPARSIARAVAAWRRRRPTEPSLRHGLESATRPGPELTGGTRGCRSPGSPGHPRRTARP